MQNSQLTRLLLANSAHEVRTPLNAIINYLEIALEGALDQETRDNLAKSHSASKSLIYVINDLLDLTKTEEGHNLVKDEIFDLAATIKEATDSFAGDAKRKSLEYEVILNSLPLHVVGDQRRVRQAVSNVTANAIKHTSSGGVKGEAWLTAHVDDRVDIDVSVQDTGVGMSPDKLDALFRELEQVQSESDESLQEKLAPSTNAVEGSDSKRTLGLGLAVVARIIRNTNGQLRLKSEEGKGSRFVMQFSFCLPDNEAPPKLDAVNSSTKDVSTLSQPSSPGSARRALAAAPSQDNALVSPPSDQPTTPPVEVGEVMLVNRSAQKGQGLAPETKELARKVSMESLQSQRSVSSLKSFKSGSSARSDVDRLIDAIQEPTMANKSLTEADSHAGSRGLGRTSRPGSSSSARLSGGMFRSHSYQPTSMNASTPHKTSGQSFVTDSRTPIKPVRMGVEESTDSPISDSAPKTPSKVTFDLRDDYDQDYSPLDAHNLNVLVAEDDPINSKIMKKRLEKLGHTVHLTVNGEECSSVYGDQPISFDVILMDMQVSSPCKMLADYRNVGANVGCRCRSWMALPRLSSSDHSKRLIQDHSRSELR